MQKADSLRATLLIMAIFFLQPVTIGGWLAMIPVIKADIGLSKGQLAVALFGMPVALIPSLQMAGRLVSRFGPRRLAMVSFPLQGLAILLPLVAWDVWSLFAVLALAGVIVAAPEVAMNVYAGRLEKRARVMIMVRCHGFWALGLMSGSAVVAAAGGAPVALIALAAGSAVGGVLAAVVLPRIGDDSEGSSLAVPRRRLSEMPRALWFIGGYMLLVTMTEGAMADWSAVYLSERLGGEAERAGIAVTVFSAFMAGGRFLGDWLKRLFGAMGLALAAGGIAFVGLVCLVLPLPLAFTYLGFALVGFGVSPAYPLGVSAVAALDDRHEAGNIALMAMMALCGFLLGPPVIGGLSELISLRAAFGALIPAILIALVLSQWLRPPESRGESPRIRPGGDF